MRHQPEPPPSKQRRLSLLLIVAVTAALVVGVGGGIGATLLGGGRDEAEDTTAAGAVVNGSSGQALQDAADDIAQEEPEAAREAEPAPEKPPAETAQVRLVGPSRVEPGEPITVVAAFRELPKGSTLRAYIQAMTGNGRVGETKAVSSCKLDRNGADDTRTGTCPAVPAGNYRLAVVVEPVAQRPGDFPPVDVGRLVVAEEATQAQTQPETETEGSGNQGSGSIPSADAVQAVEQRMVALVNQERAQEGAGPLRVDGGLTAASRDWSCEMAAENELSHDPNFADSGAQGENVAFRTDAGDDVALLLHEQFMNSPPHRENLLNPRWGEIGIGYCPQNGFWVTQRFAP